MSEKPLAERLQVKGERRLAVLDADPSIDATVGATNRRTGLEAADVVLCFVADLASLENRLPTVSAKLRPDAILWLAYPKLTSPMARDLSRDLIARYLMPRYGFDTVGMIAIDGNWSALRLKKVS